MFCDSRQNLSKGRGKDVSKLILSKGDRKEALNLLVKLVSIPSPSRKERDIADYIIRWLSEKGFSDIKKDGVGNVRAKTLDDEPLVTYCSHMDTVPGFIPVRLVKGKLVGRGASDAKGPLAAMLYSASVLSKMRIPVEVLAVVGEEENSKGIRYALREKPLNFAVFGEPTGADKIVIGYKGRIEAVVDFYSPSFHASMPWVGKSALQYAIDFIQKIESHFEDSRQKDYSRNISVCITRFKSGVACNVAPPRATLGLDIRIPLGARTDKILRDLNNLCRATGVPKFKIRVKEKIDAVSASNGYLLKAMRRAIYKVLGSSALMVRKTGTGDMNYAIKHKAEAITYGPGNGLTEHSGNESIEIEDFFRSIEVLSILPFEIANILAVSRK